METFARIEKRLDWGFAKNPQSQVTRAKHSAKRRLDPETVRMLKRFIAIYRPLFAELAGADPENPHLFPGAGSKRKERGINGGYEKGFGCITNEKLSQRFRQHI